MFHSTRVSEKQSRAQVPISSYRCLKQRLSGLARVNFMMFLHGARDEDVEAAEGAVKSMADARPDGLTFKIHRFEGLMNAARL